MPVSAADQLRLLNLAYHQMQADFKRILPDLFRGDAQSLTTSAAGYIFLPLNSFEVELLTLTSSGLELEPMPKSLKNIGTGWYHDGIHQTADANQGKRRIMLRNAGAAWASVATTVDILIEYPSLTTLSGTPYPFVQQRYLNMLTELQTFMLHTEGGKEAADQAKGHWEIYQFLLSQVKKDALDKRPQFVSQAHSDAGDTSPSRFITA